MAVSRKYSLLVLLMTPLCWGVVFPLSQMLIILVPLAFVFFLIVDRRKILKANNHKELFKDKGYHSFYYVFQLYILWCILSVVYGLFMARNYFEYKHLIQNACACLLPLSSLLFINPLRFSIIWSKWYKYIWFIGPILYLLYGALSQDIYSPLILLICFMPLLNRKYRIAIFVFIPLFLIACFISESREPILRFGISVILGCLLFFKKVISDRFIKLLKYTGYSLIVILFFVVLPNFFVTISGQNSEMGKVFDERLGVDTRSLLYFDVIKSAIDNNYVIQGRSLSRGNDIINSGMLFQIADDNGFYDDTELVNNERTANEMCYPNIFTWMGLIGVVMYMWLIIKAVNLATNHSRNIYVKLLGCYLAFRWSLGWIGEVTGFTNANLALWSMIAICASPYFRNMTENEFKSWFKSMLA